VGLHRRPSSEAPTSASELRRRLGRIPDPTGGEPCRESLRSCWPLLEWRFWGLTGVAYATKAVADLLIQGQAAVQRPQAAATHGDRATRVFLRYIPPIPWTGSVPIPLCSTAVCGPFSHCRGAGMTTMRYSLRSYHPAGETVNKGGGA